MIVWYTMYIYTYFPTPGTELRRAFWTGRSLTKTPKCGDDYCSQWFDLSSVSIPILLRCFFLIQNPPQINFPVLPTACRGMVFPWVFTAFKWLLIQLNFCDGSWLLGNKLKEWWKGRWKIPCRLGYIWVMDSCICSLVDPQIHIWLYIYIFIQIHQTSWSTDHALMPLLDVSLKAGRFVSVFARSTPDNWGECNELLGCYIGGFLRGDTMP